MNKFNGFYRYGLWLLSSIVGVWSLPITRVMLPGQCSIKKSKWMETKEDWVSNKHLFKKKYVRMNQNERRLS